MSRYRMSVSRENGKCHSVQADREESGYRGKSPEGGQSLQLIICIAIFLAVFVGKGVFPTKLDYIQGQMLAVMNKDINWRETFASLGGAMGEDGQLLLGMEKFYKEAFGVKEREAQETTAVFFPAKQEMLDRELRKLSEKKSMEEIVSDYLEPVYGELDINREKQIHTNDGTQSEKGVEQEGEPVVPAVGTIIMEMNYTGRELPQNYTMDHISLGALETMTPVFGHLNSGYGYRDHPINGEYQFHGGVDIGGQMGEPIFAFGNGTVEYIGEDPSYGLYMQIDHGNGVKSFYAHCNKLLVSKGMQVKIGEKIAEVGSSGAATGPHLHLELKYNQLHLNPIYYIDCLSA